MPIKNPIKRKEYQKKYWKEYYSAHREEYTAKSRKRYKIYYQNNKQKKLFARKEWGKRNIEHRRMYSNKRYHTDAGIFISIYQSARKQKIPISKREDILSWYKNTPKICIYCDLPLEYLFLDKRAMQKRVTRLTVDRKDNDRGYYLDNIALACCSCNFTKSDVFTYKEMREIAQHYIKPKWVKQIALQEKLNEIPK